MSIKKKLLLAVGVTAVVIGVAAVIAGIVLTAGAGAVVVSAAGGAAVATTSLLGGATLGMAVAATGVLGAAMIAGVSGVLYRRASLDEQKKHLKKGLHSYGKADVFTATTDTEPSPPVKDNKFANKSNNILYRMFERPTSSKNSTHINTAPIPGNKQLSNIKNKTSSIDRNDIQQSSENETRTKGPGMH